ncbi:MAG: ATP-binding cassette domain-containing protein, partial [Gemmatimonadales bacterium]
MGHRINKNSNQLSGVTRQRDAISRALVNQPSILLADEPTGNLDSTTSGELMAVFRDLHRQGQTIIMVTHEQDIAAHAARVVTLHDGVVSGDQRRAA